MSRSRAWRRWKNFVKARRKHKLDGELTPYFYNNEEGAQYRFLYYRNLHEYSKGKIHCSCMMCRAKTRNKGHRKSWAPALNYKPSDRRRIDSMNWDEQED